MDVEQIVQLREGNKWLESTFRKNSIEKSGSVKGFLDSRSYLLNCLNTTFDTLREY